MRVGFTVSIAVHLILALLATWWMSVKPPLALPKPAKTANPPVKVIFAKDIKVLPPKPPELKPPAPRPKGREQFVRTSQNQAESAAPANAEFISDRNTIASNTLPAQANGAKGLPTTHGKKDLPSVEMTNRDYVDGEVKDDASKEPPPSMIAAQPKPREPMEEMLPEPIKPKPNTQKIDSPPAKATPVKAKTPAKKPLDPPILRDPRADEKAFQPQTRTSDRAGTVDQPGLENAVNARSTPRGQYIRKVTGEIEKRWHFLRSQRADFVQPGKLRLRFYVNRDGKVRPQDIFIVSSNANPVLTDFSLQAIMEANIPPIPQELLSQLEQDRVEIEYDIVIY